MNIETMAQSANVLVYSAMAVYVLAFIAFALDLARKASPTSTELALTAAKAGTVATLLSDRPARGDNQSQIQDASPAAAPKPEPRSRFARVGLALTVLAWILHVAATVLRGVAAERVPWANMFEFTLTSSAIIVCVFLLVQLWQRLEFLGVFIIGFTTLALGVATTNFYVEVVPLQVSLQSGWLVVHVFVAASATGFLAVGAGLSIIQLLQTRRATRGKGAAFLVRLPEADPLENLAYRVNIVGFMFWTFTLMAGAVWAESAWGRYWGWDTKEVWTFIIWVIYAGYIHARATRGWRGSRSAWLSIIGFSAVLFNFTIVNLFFKGWHAYSGL